jgi:hypothetical protein
MKYLLVALMLLSFGAFGGEKVTVTWTPDATSTQDSYRLYYTDSTGTGHQVDIPAYDASDNPITTHEIPDVEFGPSQWAMDARCSFCSVKVSSLSESVDFIVVSKSGPKPPLINEVVVFKAPGSASKTIFRAKVAGKKYRGRCRTTRHSKNLVCYGTTVKS